MKYGVVCYAIHNKNIVRYDWFDDIDNAVMFLQDDAQTTYEEAENDVGHDNVNSCVVGHYAMVSVNNGEYEWTWHIIDDSKR